MTIEQQLEHIEILGTLDQRRLQGSPHERTLTDVDMGEGADAVDRLGARRVDRAPRADRE